VEKILKESKEEEIRQAIAKIEKKKAVERGEDPANVRLGESRKEKTEQVDDDIARLGV
jgi:hypothetical protein